MMASEAGMSVPGLQTQRTTDDIESDMTTEEKKTALAAVISFMAAIIALGTIGNLLVIGAVVQSKKLQTVSNMFVANLSTCDLMFVTIVLPVNMYTYLGNGWRLPGIVCKFVAFICYTLTGTTVITITLIAWNRYKLVVDVSRYKQLFRPRNMALMLASSWIIPVMFLQPAVFESWGHFGYIPMLSSCNLDLDSSSQSFKIFLLIVRAAIPCGLIVYFYSSIYAATRASHRRLHSRACSVSTIMRQHNHRREMRLTKMMIAIFVVFVLSYFPCTVSSVIDFSKLLSKTIHMFCQTSVFLGSAVNPLLYGLMNEQFRNAYYQILTCRLVRRCQHDPVVTQETTCVEHDDKIDVRSRAMSCNIYRSLPTDKTPPGLIPAENVSAISSNSPALNSSRRDQMFSSMATCESTHDLVQGHTESSSQWKMDADTQALCQPVSLNNVYMFQNSCT